MGTATLENIARLAKNLPLEEQLILVEKLAQNLRRRVNVGRTGHEPQNLYGIWQTVVPKDFNIDAALSEIRSDYKNEFEENS